MKSEQTDRFISLKEVDSTTKQFGRLYLGSKTRICLLNNQIKELIDTGDEVLYYKQKLYYKGRFNKIRKINGKLLNLNLLQKVGFNFESNY